MSLPTLIKSEFFGGPKDGDKEAVAQPERGLAFDAHDPGEVHVYVGTKTRMDYMGIIDRALVVSTAVLPLEIGKRR